jgi:DNA ligase (NAD+)
MNKIEAKNRIEKLKEIINYHRYQYHVLNKEEISIEALDSLKKELFELEQKFPDFITKDSPTQRVEGKPLDKFEKFEHPVRMTSFNDAFSKEDIEEWLKRNKKLLTSRQQDNIEFYCEPKLDGLAIEIIYRNGILEIGSTRGDGRIGENVTQNLKTIESIPLNINYEKELIVRGEAVITKKGFEEINKQEKKNYANPRNLAAGTIRQLDPKVVKRRKLDADIYSIASDFGLKTHEEEHKVLEKLGFKTNNKYNKLCKNLEEVFMYYEWLSKKRESLPYEIDGVVITINDNEIFKKLGIVGKAPRGAIAFKFAQKQSTTIIKDIEFQTGRTGAITPVAILKPVLIEGVTISRATLHNEQEIRRLDIKIGDTVIVGRAGDVIPEIVGAIKELRIGKEKEILIPQKCPSCETELVRKSGDILWFCPNKNCYNRKSRAISHFVSKQAFNIVGLGPNIVKQLLENNLINDSADIFTLKKGDLLELEGFEEKASDNLINAINNARQISFPKFIFSLGIDNVGQETANVLADRFKSLENLKKAEHIVLESVLDIGPVVAESIIEWFKHNDEFLDKLLNSGVEIVYQKKSNKLKDLKFVLTGTLSSISRDDLKDIIRSRGGDVSSSVSSNIDYVIVGENPGSKYDKAQKLNLKIITEDKINEIIGPFEKI